MMMLLVPEEAIASVARSLGMRSDRVPTRVGNALVAQALRRAAFILAPCFAHELVRAVSGSLAALAPDDGEFADRVEAALEGLIAYGDILEMRADAENPWADGGSYTLRAAPPSFVARRDGSIAILGVAGDQISALTDDLETRIVYRGLLRILPSLPGEDLAAHLKELGLLPLAERTWLRLPSNELASSCVERIRAVVASEPNAASTDGFRLLDTARPVTFYRDRWVEPRSQHTGLYVARRPQLYGSSRWCVAEVELGRVKRFKDLRDPGDRIRPSDLAWRIQAAFDSLAGHPQQYRANATDGLMLLRFYSPLPSWAERRLAVVGIKTKAERCLFSYEIPNEDWPGERSFLSEALWMVQIA